jgi:hypothetical protein
MAAVLPFKVLMNCACHLPRLTPGSFFILSDAGGAEPLFLSPVDHTSVSKTEVEPAIKNMGLSP